MIEFNLLGWGKDSNDISRTLLGTMKIVAGKIVFDFKEDRWLKTISSAPQEIMDGPAREYYDFVIAGFCRSSLIEMIEKEG